VGIHVEEGAKKVGVGGDDTSLGFLVGISVLEVLGASVGAALLLGFLVGSLVGEKVVGEFVFGLRTKGVGADVRSTEGAAVVGAVVGAEEGLAVVGAEEGAGVESSSSSLFRLVGFFVCV